MLQEIVKRQARILEQLAKEDISERSSGADIESEICKAIEVVFSCPEQSSRAMERPEVLQEGDGVKVVKAVAQNPEEADVCVSTGATAAVLDEQYAGRVSRSCPGSSIGWMNSESVTPEQPADISCHEHDDRHPACLVQSGTRPDCGIVDLGSIKQEDLPGMRMKRTLEDVQKEDFASARGRNQNCTLQCTASFGTLTPDIGADGAQAPIIRATGGANGIEYEALPEAYQSMVHTELRSGVCVPHDDAFVLWSSHIRQCDEKEECDHGNN